jgi:hypothetical protein
LELIQAEYKLRWWKIFCLISCNVIGNCILVLSLDWIDIIANKIIFKISKKNRLIYTYLFCF